MITKPKIQIDLKQVESLAANGLTQEQIAAALGISESTLTKRKKKTWILRTLLKGGKAKGIALVTNKLMESIKGGNMTGMIFENTGSKRQTAKKSKWRTNPTVKLQ